ncbi:MAG: HD domain-containing protein [Alphaproteobacteria bacterium]|nr:HD domain-containing protein [Alphaproteobacteria bacterium]
MALTLEDVRCAFPEGAERYRHIAGVVQLADVIENNYGGFNGELKTAALYHDIGYAETWCVTGFHPVDGSLVARQHGFSSAVIEAILYHSGSWDEARQKRPDLSIYYDGECCMMQKALSRALTFCDLRTGPVGQSLSLAQRLADIRGRCGENAPWLQTAEEYADRFQKIDDEWSVYVNKEKGLWE